MSKVQRTYSKVVLRLPSLLALDQHSNVILSSAGTCRDDVQTHENYHYLRVPSISAAAILRAALTKELQELLVFVTADPEEDLGVKTNTRRLG